MDNLISFDWLSFSYKGNDVSFVKRFLGLRNVDFTLVNGSHGCRKRYYYEGISINFGSVRDDIWVEFTGSGCRTFEHFSSLTWDKLFRKLIDFEDKFHFARLDVAYDDYNYVLDLDLIDSEIEKHNYVSCFRSAYCDKQYHNNGKTIYFGSPRSDVRFRIYNKAVEQKVTDTVPHWIRFEMQLRNERAYNFVLNYVLTDFDLGYVFTGVINNYLRFVDFEEGKRIYNADISAWWSAFIQNTARIKLFTKRNLKQNMTNVAGYVINGCGNAIFCVINGFGVDKFLDMLYNRSVKPNIKYDMILDNFLNDCFKNQIGIPF